MLLDVFNLLFVQVFSHLLQLVEPFFLLLHKFSVVFTHAFQLIFLLLAEIFNFFQISLEFFEPLSLGNQLFFFLQVCFVKAFDLFPLLFDGGCHFSKRNFRFDVFVFLSLT